jgi:hypothetical protein
VSDLLINLLAGIDPIDVGDMPRQIGRLTDFIELVADVTGEAFDPPGERPTVIAPDASAPAA